MGVDRSIQAISLLITLWRNPVHTGENIDLSFKDSIKISLETILSSWVFIILLFLYLAKLLYYAISLISANGDDYDIYEPFFWFDGISIWPTEIIRSLIAILSLYFFWRSWKIIEKDKNYLGKKFFNQKSENLPSEKLLTMIKNKIKELFGKPINFVGKLFNASCHNWTLAILDGVKRW